MPTEKTIKIDIVKVQMIKDGTIEYGKKLSETLKTWQHSASNSSKMLTGRYSSCSASIPETTSLHRRSKYRDGQCLSCVPTEVLKIAILSNASEIAILHNHPSGDVEPSEDDLKSPPDWLNVQTLRHQAPGPRHYSDDGRCQSFMEKGLIKHT